ncbi:uracil-DNA glycosylase [Haliangium ochraceum]|uniref:Uracil-DNA glycosylase superfamily n=1 Tax=Haliangium ochraceum (strain DSM 14365 / JCM 11303 / SMP-2) TaxID=502025 RepID=D0LKM6_HALO1|nr:uracil-DNA glycosylase family protein [Haliangium ochraceum]ACY15074.1 Uracil-DNA glycosylase superfamily [Haliangium ochraceum DSM 14365]
MTPTANPPAQRATQRALRTHIDALRLCRLCPDMHAPPIPGPPVVSPLMLLGQAPGRHEGRVGRPFGWKAGKTLFTWFAGIGLPEEALRQRVYIAAVCRCFPGPHPSGGGDRVPKRAEIERCHGWLAREIELLRPRLIIPIGKLAIAQLMPVRKLSEVVGGCHRIAFAGHTLDAIPLPHPSGISTWHRRPPGSLLLAEALERIAAHAAFNRLLR